ncbi:MAG TPA: hypothetical protein VK689_23470 [Armatimonadota bacterium]|nr:hypothetical protein [Armatimonadota bacterium]
MQVDTDWAALHRRVVVGENLTESERAAYEAGCSASDDDETLDGNLLRLQRLRAQLISAVVEQQDLREREAELDARIAALESRLDPRTRQLLGIGS